MADFDFFALEESQLTISGGAQLSGVTQGDGSHLVGVTVTLNSNEFQQIFVSDGGTDAFFDDNDNDQRLRLPPDGDEDEFEFDDEEFEEGIRIEAEFLITLFDPVSEETFVAIAVNFNNSSPSYATVEGLAFVEKFPPVGVPLEVISASEGPGDFGIPRILAEDIAAPPCFTPGSEILTPHGPRAVESLSVGDLVLTLDHGAQPLRWIGRAEVGAFAMAMSEALRPIRIRKNAFGPGQPARDMLVSPQHRVLLEGWQAELLYGELQVLVAAMHLVDDRTVTRAWDVTQTVYIHLQCDNHELLYSDGLLTESFNPGPQCLAAIPQAARDELEALFPNRDLTHTTLNTAVRPMITRREAQALGQIA
ncbi:MAG: Hint domain-containing protein [Pseudomonadota bacterium]